MSDAQEGPGPDVPPAPHKSAVPLFPLPNVVLFPRAVLPLHVFEERYKTMTADALRGERQVAMALLQPGWERNYYQKPAIEPVVCVGTILSHEKLPDGKYNFLLQGHTRARIVREPQSHKPYRLAVLEAVQEVDCPDAELEGERERLTRVFRPELLGATPVGRQVRSLIRQAGVRTADLADLVAFNYFDDVRLKQALLAEADVRHRVRVTIEALEAMRPALQMAYLKDSGDPGLSLN
jgi:Lon protease-like protein